MEENSLVKFLENDLNDGKIFYKKCLTIARSRGFSREDAEDFYQELFLKAVKSRTYNPGKGKESGYLFGVLRNICKDNLRKLNSKSRYEMADGQLEEMVISNELPTRDLEIEEYNENLERVLERIPEKSKNILYLFVQGLKYDEISGALGISLGTVKSQLNRARNRIKGMFDYFD